MGAADNQIALNVGGKIYLTTRKTLTGYPISFFVTMLDSVTPSVRDAQGNYLIDRDGKIFRHVLNFMRCRELVLPRGFSEFDLLEREADFFSFEALKVALKKGAAPSVGIAVGTDGTRSTYMMTREALMREQESFFTDMLKEGKPFPRDTQGNYVISRNNSLFHHVVDYLVRGGILNDITLSELQQLRKEAKYFGLQILEQHIQSVEYMINHRSNTSGVHIHFFFVEKGPCVVYSNETLVGLQARLCIEPLRNGYKIGNEVYAGELDHLMSKFSEAITLVKFVSDPSNHTTDKSELSSNCTRIKVHALKKK